VTRPVEIYVTDHRGRPLEGGKVTVQLEGEAPLEQRAGPRGMATIQLPDDAAEVVTVQSPRGTVTAAAGLIPELLGPTPRVHAARARELLVELDGIPGDTAAWRAKLREVLGELTGAVED
jgi:hypothetical protein